MSVYLGDFAHQLGLLRLHGRQTNGSDVTGFHVSMQMEKRRTCGGKSLCCFSVSQTPENVALAQKSRTRTVKRLFSLRRVGFLTSSELGAAAVSLLCCHVHPRLPRRRCGLCQQPLCRGSDTPAKEFSPAGGTAAGAKILLFKARGQKDKQKTAEKYHEKQIVSMILQPGFQSEMLMTL